jgi:NADH-quinone oxidoreductase subunit N
MSSVDLVTLLPVLILCGWACLLLLGDVFMPASQKKWIGRLSLLGLAGAGASMISWGGQQNLLGFGGMLRADQYSLFVGSIYLCSAAVVILLALNYLPRHGLEHSEFYVLLLFSLSGMMLITQAADLIIVFLGLELLSIPLYILAGLARPRLSSEEAALKYFLLGSFATGFLVYGTALVYGATRTTNLLQIVEAVQAGSASLSLLVVGAGLIFVGFGFKVALVPFQMWTPDVYEGAPSVVTAFMSVGAKTAGFAAVLRVFVTAFPHLSVQWASGAAILAAITMILGNFAAIPQVNIKRLLAYSSIAHAGYLMVGVVAAGTWGLANLSVSSVVYYLFAYTIANLGAWAVVIAVERVDGQGLKLDDYAGLGKRHPALAVAMTVFMFSLAGLPPTVGFVSKFAIFRAALESGYLWLAIIGVLTSIFSAFYYLRVVVIMFMREGEATATTHPTLNLAVGITAVATVALGIFPAPLITWASQALLELARR